MARSRARQSQPRPAAPRSLPQVNPNAAGIDVGGMAHFVAVPADRDAEPVREFGPFTNDLYRLAEWLTACGIETVALESTGVSWIPLFAPRAPNGETMWAASPAKITRPCRNRGIRRHWNV